MAINKSYNFTELEKHFKDKELIKKKLVNMVRNDKDTPNYAGSKELQYKLAELRLYSDHEKVLDIMKSYVEQGFDWLQIWEICMGVKENLDVSIYAKKEYDNQRMFYIRRCLERGFDYSWILDLKLSGSQVVQIFLGLIDELDVSKYAHPEIDYKEMRTIRNSMKNERSDNNKHGNK